jgi:hypothetical protein
LCVSSVAACGSADPDPGSANAETSEPGYTEGARVSFSAEGWEPTWSGTPKAGGHLAIDYDFARLPQCRNQSRLVSWVVEVSWRFDGGATSTAALPGSPGAGETLPKSGIAIPEGARSIELWFENRAVGGYDDCEAWDSRYGANYTHALAP